MRGYKSGSKGAARCDTIEAEIQPPTAVTKLGCRVGRGHVSDFLLRIVIRVVEATYGSPSSSLSCLSDDDFHPKDY